jgi:hypothetical protein
VEVLGAVQAGEQLAAGDQRPQPGEAGSRGAIWAASAASSSTTSSCRSETWERNMALASPRRGRRRGRRRARGGSDRGRPGVAEVAGRRWRRAGWRTAARRGKARRTGGRRGRPGRSCRPPRCRRWPRPPRRCPVQGRHWGHHQRRPPGRTGPRSGLQRLQPRRPRADFSRSATSSSSTLLAPHGARTAHPGPAGRNLPHRKCGWSTRPRS